MSNITERVFDHLASHGGGPMTVRRMADELGLKTPQVIAAANSLKAKGLTEQAGGATNIWQLVDKSVARDYIPVAEPEPEPTPPAEEVPFPPKLWMGGAARPAFEALYLSDVPLTVGQVTSRSGRAQTAVVTALQRMVTSGHIRRVSIGLYGMPDRTYVLPDGSTNTPAGVPEPEPVPEPRPVSPVIDPVSAPHSTGIDRAHDADTLLELIAPDGIPITALTEAQAFRNAALRLLDALNA